jgi:hypothetical protein
VVLSLELLVSQSVTLSSCYNPDGQCAWGFAPIFNLTALTLSSQPTNSENGKLSGVHGQVATPGAAGNSFTVSLPVSEGPETLSIAANSATVDQGVNDFSTLAVGNIRRCGRRGPIQRFVSRHAHRGRRPRRNQCPYRTTPRCHRLGRGPNPRAAPGRRCFRSESGGVWCLYLQTTEAPCFKFPGSYRTCRLFPLGPVLPRQTWWRDRMSMGLLQPYPKAAHSLTQEPLR